MSEHVSKSPIAASRREFLRGSSLAVAGATLAGGLSVARSAHAAGDDAIRVGLIGCGGRGTGAAANALGADANIRLTAMGDMFADRLQQSLSTLQKTSPDKISVTPETSFVGFDAYKKVLAADVDVVLLCTPPHFRPAQFKAAIAAGKHCFVEKPVAVDAPGVRSVLETVEQAKQKNLAVVSGLCYRYDLPKREVFNRIHNGEIGDVLTIHVAYNAGLLWSHPRQPEWTDMENQLRNWLYYTWLSGDFNVEQHVHSLDKAAWAMRDEPPAKVYGLGGRQARTDPEFGHIYDHMACVYEYANGTRLFSNCRQMGNCPNDVSDLIVGSKGQALVMKHEITGGGNRWRYRGPEPSMYDHEHVELYASIRAGKPLNNGLYMCRSTMMGIMGRMACYTGQTITWDEAMNSKEDLTPASYEFGPLPTPPVAKPGFTKFV